MTEMWRCPICNALADSLMELGRHMGKTRHGTVVVKDAGPERKTLVLVTPLNPSAPDTRVVSLVAQILDHPLPLTPRDSGVE